MVYQIDGQIRHLLWVGENRTTAVFESFFDLFGGEILPTLKFVCSDMWKPYLGLGKTYHQRNVLRTSLLRAGDKTQIARLSPDAVNVNPDNPATVHCRTSGA